MSSTCPMYIVDAFAKKPFEGNPAAICLIGNQKLDDRLMQKIGAEMNLSETAFVTLPDGANSYKDVDTFGLRWFTPTVEVNLCGHATFATAKVLFSCIGNPNKELKFNTLSGELRATQDGDTVSIYLPDNVPIKMMDKTVEPIIDVICRNEIRPEEVLFIPPTGYLVLRIPDTCTMKQFEDWTFDIGQLVKVHDSGLVRTVILTMKGSAENGCVDPTGVIYDYVNRVFGPWAGIDEDPVTGSAHCSLAAYWSGQLNKTKLYARQCSARGGELILTYHKDKNMVELNGHGCVIVEGRINI